MEKTFGSTCHGAGRVMSRAQSKKQSQAINIDQEMARRGVVARYQGRGTMAEEMPHAYKDVADVVETMDRRRHFQTRRALSRRQRSGRDSRGEPHRTSASFEISQSPSLLQDCRLTCLTAESGMNGPLLQTRIGFKVRDVEP